MKRRRPATCHPAVRRGNWHAHIGCELRQPDTVLEQICAEGCHGAKIVIARNPAQGELQGHGKNLRSA
jgi:hypothetical protein